MTNDEDDGAPEARVAHAGQCHEELTCERPLLGRQLLLGKRCPEVLREKNRPEDEEEDQRKRIGWHV